MRIHNYSASLKMADNVTTWLHDYEVELEVSVDGFGDSATVSVDDVLIDVSAYREPSRFISMFCEAASPLMVIVGREIQMMAEADPRVLDEALEDRDPYSRAASRADFRRQEILEGARL